MYRWVSSRLLAALLTVAVTLAGAVGLLIFQDHRDASAAERARAEAAAQAQEAWEADLEQAREEQAERERIAAENDAAREEARQELAAQRTAEERAAAKEAAKLAAQRAKAAADRAAKLAEEKRLAEERAKRHTIQGTVLVPDVPGAVKVRVGARAGQSLADLSEAQRAAYDSQLKQILGGVTAACPTGTGGARSDIVSGAQVTVEDSEGTLLTTGALTGGTLTRDGCQFSFALEVGYAEAYRVRLTQRGPATWSREEMVNLGWRVALTL